MARKLSAKVNSLCDANHNQHSHSSKEDEVPAAAKGGHENKNFIQDALHNNSLITMMNSQSFVVRGNAVEEENKTLKKEIAELQKMLMVQAKIQGNQRPTVGANSRPGSALPFEKPNSPYESIKLDSF